jgi:LytR cell envelope-related transcriptional attenuator
MGASPFGAARLSRRLTLEQAAARANMDVDQIKSLEDNCVYRFGSNADALTAAIVYAASLRITEREARKLAGLPEPSRLDPWSIRRMLAALAFMVTATALAWFIVWPQVFPEADDAVAAAPSSQHQPAPEELLPARWQIQVDVFNGTDKGNAAAGLANQIAGLAYKMGTVGNAKQHNYARTLVYYPPGAEAIAERLAGELGVGTTALPGGDNPLRLVVIVGKTT